MLLLEPLGKHLGHLKQVKKNKEEATPKTGIVTTWA